MQMLKLRPRLQVTVQNYPGMGKPHCKENFLSKFYVNSNMGKRRSQRNPNNLQGGVPWQDAECNACHGAKNGQSNTHFKRPITQINSLRTTHLVQIITGKSQ